MERRREQNKHAQRRYRQRKRTAVQEVQLYNTPSSLSEESSSLNIDNATDSDIIPSVDRSHSGNVDCTKNGTLIHNDCLLGILRPDWDFNPDWGSNTTSSDCIPFVANQLDYLETQLVTQDGRMASSAYECSPSSDGTADKAVKTAWLSPLHLAAQRGHDRNVSTLLKYHADCNARDSDGLTPLAHAVIGGHQEVVNILLSHGASIDNLSSRYATVLHCAVLHRRGRVLEALLEHCSRNNVVIDCYDSAGKTPLHAAIEIDFEQGLQLLLQFGANVHSKAGVA
ncbi:hypothetical protein QQS21_001463 [Conoideocrella luteorostrata]|uniref:BZIP domain-containing protein n=1 Tax=Conoideocrella luteorostrata TaxID=1105319 RepID=A0AAJ0G1V6_9HYPO|nr:hypothetical protein QQS21_001463 [Conoideocrella luteorostrata]